MKLGLSGSRVGLLLRLFYFFGFLNFLGFLELRFVEFATLKLILSHEALRPDKLLIIVWTFAGILEIHESLNGDKPGPLLIAISGAKVIHFLIGSELKASWDHVFVLPEIALVGFDLSQVDELGHFLEVAIREDEHIVFGEHQPPLPPLLQKFGPFVDWPLSDFVGSELSFNRFGIHVYIH